jgi:hypothetical protein
MPSWEGQSSWKDKVVQVLPTEFVLDVIDLDDPAPNPPGGDKPPKAPRPAGSMTMPSRLTKGDAGMPELANPIPKTRVQLDLSLREVERMNWMMEVCGIETRKDLFNNALTVLEWVVGEVVEGKKIASFNDSTKERSILSMPVLNTATVRGGRYMAKDEVR